jgi:hypothetical protein
LAAADPRAAPGFAGVVFGAVLILLGGVGGYACLRHEHGIWRGRRNELDRLWFETGQQLGLQVTIGRAQRRIEGRLMGADLVATDRYGLLRRVPLGRLLRAASPVAGVRIGTRNATSSFSVNIWVRPSPIVGRWSTRSRLGQDSLQGLPVNAQQALLRELTTDFRDDYQLRAGAGWLTFSHVAFPINSSNGEEATKPCLPLKMLLSVCAIACDSD